MITVAREEKLTGWMILILRTGQYTQQQAPFDFIFQIITMMQMGNCLQNVLKISTFSDQTWRGR